MRPCTSLTACHGAASRSIAQYRAGRYRRALGEFFLEENVGNLYNMGNAYARLHEWSGAKAAYRKALSLDPAHEDARHNLALVVQAEELDQRRNEARQPSRKLGRWRDGNRETPQPDKREGGKVEKGTADKGAGQSADTTAAIPGRREKPGMLGDKPLSKSPKTGPAGATPIDTPAPEAPSGTGTALILRESTQAAEVLLRRIRDDPARVLAARLGMAHRLRRERAGK